MARIVMSILLSLGIVLALVPAAGAYAPPEPFFNGLEDDQAGLDADEQFMTVTRAPSGTGGVASAAGDFHAVAAPTDFGAPDGYVFSRLGGYGTDFPNGGFTTSVDVYLDPSMSPPEQDLRLDWSVAINKPDGNHQRDFIFHIGTDGDGGFVASASNNAPGWPANPSASPHAFTGGGWYTLLHEFNDVGGVLSVDMSLLDDSGTVLATWTRSDPSDVIGGTVGGNRYGWLVTNDFAELHMDNLRRSGVLSPHNAKVAAADELFAMLPTGDTGDDKRIEKAIEAINDSLDPSLWVDNTHLDPDDGKDVFKAERKAAKELEKVDTVDVSAQMDALVTADAVLATTAIDDATAALDAADCEADDNDCDKAAKELEKALEDMAKAADEVADGDADKAIERYRKAWEHAQKALGELPV